MDAGEARRWFVTLGRTAGWLQSPLQCPYLLAVTSPGLQNGVLILPDTRSRCWPSSPCNLLAFYKKLMRSCQ